MAKPALLPSPRLTWFPKTPEMGEYPPKGAHGGVAEGMLPKSLGGSRVPGASACQGAGRGVALQRITLSMGGGGG